MLVLTPVSGQDSAELKVTLQTYIDSVTEHSAIPGLTLGVALPNGTVLGLAAGYADTLTHRTMRPSDRMLQGSVGKTYFGAVALQLVADGRIDLDARLATYLGGAPWYGALPNGFDVTIRQLMNHTSGIVRYEFNPAFLEDLTREPMRTWTPEQRLAYLAGMEPPFAAGEGWDYSDTNFILVAMVVEEVLGTQIYDEIDERWLDPLDLDDTVRSDRPEVPGIANGYAGADHGFGTFDATLEGGQLAFNPQFEWAGGGFASTASDLASWTQAIHEGRAFPTTMFDDFRTGVPAPLGPEGSYGLGVIMMELPAGTAWGHSGFMPGYRTEAYYFPDGGFSIALQVNSSDRAAFDRSPLRIVSDLAEIVAGTSR
jgi:D-alanyl-D-alanine carboxypeptidase